MKRRDLLKSASVIAAAPFLTSWPNSLSATKNYQLQVNLNQISRFGDKLLILDS
jgi:hypothetical protein